MDLKTIAKFEGGSRAYGLSTSESDIDLRWIFLHTEIDKILGLSRFEHDSQKTTETDDVFGYELRFFLNLLKRGNTQAQEMLFNNIWLEKSFEFDIIQNNKFNLIDSERIFKTLLGYINGEKHIITGTNHKGKLGEKRRLQLEKYGYSYRNCVHALRLLRVGILFFRDNIYTVNIVEKDKEYGEFIRDVKLNPQNHNAKDLLELIENLENDLKKSFDLRSANYFFNEKIANEICFDLYFPILKNER